MAISKRIRKAMSESYHEYWGQFPTSERDMIRRDLKRKGKHSLSAIELYHLKGLLARRGEVEDWIQKIDGHVDYEENKHEIIATYGEPLPGEETDAEAREKMEEVETEHRDYIIKNLEEAIEAEKVGKPMPFEYATVDDFVADIRRDMILSDEEIEDVLRPTPVEVKEAIAKLPRAVKFEFEDMKRSLDMVTGDVEKLTKTVKKFVTKTDLKSELKGMEDRITEKMTEKIGVITTEQIRKELQRLREEYAKLPPVEVPPKVPEVPEIIPEIIPEVEEEIEAPTEGYIRELDWIASKTPYEIKELKVRLMSKYATLPPFGMSKVERLELIEIMLHKLFTWIPETEEGISNLEMLSNGLKKFVLPIPVKNRLLEEIDGLRKMIITKLEEVVPEIVVRPPAPPKKIPERVRIEEEIPHEERREEIREWLWAYRFYYEDDLKEAQERIAEERHGMPFNALPLSTMKEVSEEAKLDLDVEGKSWHRNSNLEGELWGKLGFATYKPTPTNYWWLWENDPEGFERDKGWFSAPYCLLYQRLIVDKTLTYKQIKDVTGIPSYVINTYIDKCREERIARGLPVEV